MRRIAITGLRVGDWPVLEDVGCVRVTRLVTSRTSVEIHYDRTGSPFPERPDRSRIGIWCALYSDFPELDLYEGVKP